MNSENITEPQESPIERRRRLNNAANKKYRQTEKGKVVNARKCRKYFLSHKEQCEAYTAKYKSSFLAKYGVSFTSWMYWRKKLEKGMCDETQVPQKFSLLIVEWKSKKSAERLTVDSEVPCGI